MTVQPPTPMPAPAPVPRNRSERVLPDAASAFVIVYRTLLRSVRTKGRLVSLAGLVGLAVLMALLSRSSPDVSELERGVGLASAVISQLVAFGALLIASSVLGDLYDNGSIVYVVLRPVSGRVVAAAAWAASCTIVLPAAIAAAASVVLVCGSDGLPAATVGAAVLAVAAYCGLFGLLGVVVRRALPVGVVFIVLWEGVVSRVGTAGAALSVSGYSRSVIVKVTGFHVKGAPFSMPTAVLVPLCVAVLTVLATGVALERRELP